MLRKISVITSSYCVINKATVFAFFQPAHQEDRLNQSPVLTWQGHSLAGWWQNPITGLAVQQGLAALEASSCAGRCKESVKKAAPGAENSQLVKVQTGLMFKFTISNLVACHQLHRQMAKTIIFITIALLIVHCILLNNSGCQHQTKWCLPASSVPAPTDHCLVGFVQQSTAQ